MPNPPALESRRPSTLRIPLIPSAAASQESLSLPRTRAGPQDTAPCRLNHFTRMRRRACGVLKTPLPIHFHPFGIEDASPCDTEISPPRTRAATLTHVAHPQAGSHGHSPAGTWRAAEAGAGASPRGRDRHRACAYDAFCASPETQHPGRLRPDMLLRVFPATRLGAKLPCSDPPGSDWSPRDGAEQTPPCGGWWI